jgi:hypothetical protein
MDTITRIFSNVETNRRSDGWLELRYDDAIRTVFQSAATAASAPLGESGSGALQLKGTGITPMSCTTPECIRGVPPVQQELVPSVEQLDVQIQFWMELQATAHIEATEGGRSCLIVRASGARVEIPIIDLPLGTDRAFKDMAKYCHDAKMGGCVAFHVYRITEATGPLAELENRCIALPIPFKLVKVATVATGRIRSSA